MKDYVCFPYIIQYKVFSYNRNAAVRYRMLPCDMRYVTNKQAAHKISIFFLYNKNFFEKKIHFKLREHRYLSHIHIDSKITTLA